MILVLANTFCCAKCSLPFTYLGLPLSLTQPFTQDAREGWFAPLCSLIRLGVWSWPILFFSGLPTFNMCTFRLPKIMIKQINKFRRHCFWWGTDINAKSPPKTAWEMVCQINSYGGLGVLNLRTHNEALLLKHLHKFFNQLDLPWVLSWPDHDMLLIMLIICILISN